MWWRPILCNAGNKCWPLVGKCCSGAVLRNLLKRQLTICSTLPQFLGGPYETDIRKLMKACRHQPCSSSPVASACVFGEIFRVCQWIFENEIEIAPFVVLVVLKIIMSWNATLKNFTPRICCLEDWHLADLIECADAAQCALYSGMFLTSDALWNWNQSISSVFSQIIFSSRADAMLYEYNT